jgi:hypothetical protein
MPTINLDGDLDDIGRVRAIMAFPNDSELRDHYIVAHTASDLVDGATGSNAISVSVDDFRRLIAAKSYQDIETLYTDSIKKGYVAGDLLGTLYVMEHFNLPEPSINKAIHAAQGLAKRESYGDGTKMHVSKRVIQDIWKEYKSVAHFWAAFRLNQDYQVVRQEDLFSPKGFLPFLGMSAALWDFGCQFIPLRASPREPILNRDESWCLPASIAIPSLELKSTPDFLLQLLETYKAPKYKI